MSNEPLDVKVWLSSPTMHGDELLYMEEAYRTNWMSTVGENIDEIERQVGEKIDGMQAVALSSGTAALHLAVKLAGVKPKQKVLCSDLTFSATVNPILYEGAIPVFIDSEYETWNMDPAALENAFRLHPEAKFVMLAHLYGTPAKVDELKSICDKYGAVLIEDAAESFGATYKGRNTGALGDMGVISFNGNKIITGSSGGMLLVKSKDEADKARKWSTQSRENAPWYQHEEVGYNYRMSNVIAGVVRGQLPYLDSHVEQKTRIYNRYEKMAGKIPITMNPYEQLHSKPNFWLSCLLIDEPAMGRQVRDDRTALYINESGKSTPSEILDALAAINAEGRPIWKPMHMQPIFRMHSYVTRDGDGRARTNAYIEGGQRAADGKPVSVSEDLFRRGLCLPSDIKMTDEQQCRVIQAITECFS